MNQTEMGACVQFFLELYPAMTEAQGVSLARAIGRFEEGAFRSAARMVVLEYRFVNDAIPALMSILRSDAQAGPRETTWVDAENEQNRVERQKAVAQHAEDDALIASAPAELLKGILTELIAEQVEPIRSIWTKRGLEFRAVRCAVAARLRKELVTK